MTIKETREKMDFLKKELDSLKPPKKGDEERLWKKFRLDFNYSSNHLEGNTLTYSQTELLLIFDKPSEGPDMREFEEMKAHDLALKMIVALANDKERDLSETFIRQLNEIILVRSFLGKAETQDGKKTMKEINPGEYKKQPNSVRLKSGEMFIYPSPEETPALMGDLMNFYKVSSVSTEAHPAWLAAMMHYKFVRIHPFDDGNGRVTRLIMNFILLKHGYPPAIIKSSKKDKDEYLYALNQADVGNDEYFQNYIYQQVIRSLEMSIKAAKGESIEEADDLDKKITLLKSDILHPSKHEPTVFLDRKSFSDIYSTWLSTLIKDFVIEVKKFNELFFRPRHYIAINIGLKSGQGGIQIVEHFQDKNEEDVLKNIWEKLNMNPIISFDTQVIMGTSYGEYKKRVLNNLIGPKASIEIFFGDLRYDIFYTDNCKDADVYPEITNKLKKDLDSNEYEGVYFDKYGDQYFGRFDKRGEKYYNGDIELKFISKEDILKDNIRTGGLVRYIESRFLDKPLNTAEIKELCKRLSNSIYEDIDFNTKERGIR